MPKDDKQFILQVFLSIIFASAAAYLLSVIAGIHQLNGMSWLLLTIIILSIVVASISYILNVPILPEDKDDRIRSIKIILIVIITTILFAISRFISFFYNTNIAVIDVEDAFNWMWIIIWACGVFLGFLTYFEFRVNKAEKNYKALGICAAILNLLSPVMILLSNILLQLRGAIT